MNNLKSSSDNRQQLAEISNTDGLQAGILVACPLYGRTAGRMLRRLVCVDTLNTMMYLGCTEYVIFRTGHNTKVVKGHMDGDPERSAATSSVLKGVEGVRG